MTSASLSAKMFPSPDALHAEIPLSSAQIHFVVTSRKTVKAILEGRDDRLLMIVGPCSIHSEKSAYAYAERFAHLAEKVADRFFLVMRAYMEKPRTCGGWKGLIFDPDLNGSNNMSRGLFLSRKILLELTERRIPLGCEFLEINTSLFYADLITWGCVGARTSASQPHRQMVSGFDLPTGFKNAPDGSLLPAIHGVLSAKNPHVFIGAGSDGRIGSITSAGNPSCHIVLRGGSVSGPNYHRPFVAQASLMCQKAKICERIVIDCSHDNCGKDHKKQIPAFHGIIKQVKEGSSSIAGLMLESHLFAGSQPMSPSCHYGCSITDPCLDWADTERLIQDAYASLDDGQKLCPEMVFSRNKSCPSPA